MKKISVNLFNKGLNLDNNPVSVSNDSLIGALNATFITKNGNEVVLQNDMGNASVDKAQLPAGYVPLGAKEHGGIIYVASYNPLTDESQIGCFPSPLRNFANSSECNLGFDSLYDFVGHGEPATLPNHYYINKPYEQRIITIDGTDGIIRPGDKFVITSTDCGDFITYKDLLKVRVLIITSDNLSIDITDELTHPRINFGDGLEFIRNISTNTTIEDSDYTIYTNRTCGQLCLKAELILPYRIELSYNATYNLNTDITDLYVHFTAYDKEGNLFQNNQITYYLELADIEGGGSLNLFSDGNVEKHYQITGATDDTTIKVKYYPQFTICNNITSSCHTAIISSIKIEDEILLSLIGSGRVTFNTFRYFNDFDNNHLVFNYGLKFYDGDSQHELTDLYLELINLRDLDAVSWNYDNVNLNKKKIALNTDNAYGVYTEIIDYLTTQQTNILSSNNILVTELSVGGENKILVGLYYLARICAQVDGTTLHKGDWHALLTSEATNYIYTLGDLDMLKLYSVANSLELLLNYNLNKNDIDIVNDQEELVGNDNYFVITQPSPGSIMRYEVKKYGSVDYKHAANAKLIIPKYFPFSESEMSYTPQVDCYVDEGINELENITAPVNYQDDIITDGTYNPSNKVKHYDSVIIKRNQNIGGNTSTTIAERNGRNKLFYLLNPGTDGSILLKFLYELYSQLISPFDDQSYSYSARGPAFVSYAPRLSNDLLKLPITLDTNGIYPDKMLYSIYYKTNFSNARTMIGVSNYIQLNDTDPFHFINNNDISPHVNERGVHQCEDFEISLFLNSELHDPNIVILSSCVNSSDTGASNVYQYGRGFAPNTVYDMMLIRGIDDNLYLIQDIYNKGVLLYNFNTYFNNVYVYTPELSISLTYWTGDPNNYFATNDYKIYLDYDINYQIPAATSSINISIHDSLTSKTLDGKTIYLPKIKLNDLLITTLHFRKSITANSISERVSDFLNPGQIIIGNIAKIINGQQTTYKLNAYNGTTKTPLNELDCYILDNNELINCKDYTGSGTLYNIAQKIKNSQLILNERYELVLNNDIISSGPQSNIAVIDWAYGDPSNVYLSTIFPNDNFKNFKLFT